MTTPIVASFSPSGTATSPDLVRLIGIASGDTVTINVVLAGPTTSNDIYSFAFDLRLSHPRVAQYVVGSAALGSVLTPGANQQADLLIAQDGDRITVGVTKLGGGAGNGVGATEEVVISLRFRVLEREFTAIRISAFQPSAIDSTGAVIDSVNFDTEPASITGS